MHHPMSTPREPSTETFRQAILELEEPLVFNNLLRSSDGNSLWKFLDWNLVELAEKFGDLSLPFRIGLNAKTSEPQWDFKCRLENMTMKEFLKRVGSPEQNEKSYYFDYKYMHEWLNDNPEILSSIDWQRFGFDKQGADSTMWVGSQGAHTNCHQDSYGCNLVAQIHGRKRWLLFPPDSGSRLHPTRIPYEESTVYSSFNLFCPSKSDEEALLQIDLKPRMVVLDPGAVLLVPSGWWHYVESIDLSVSVNVWLPIPADNQSRLGEAVVKLLVNEIGKGLIPTSDKSPVPSIKEAMELIQICIRQCNTTEPAATTSRKKFKRTEWSAQQFVSEYPKYVSVLPILETAELQALLSSNRNRFSDVEYDYTMEVQHSGDNIHDPNNDSPYNKVTNVVVNSLCHPDVIAKVTKLLLEESTDQK